MVTTYDEIRSPQDLRNNQLQVEDRAFHDWYRFILSYPPQLVRTYFSKFSLTADDLVLDPFCGTGTTLVEAKKHRIPAIGLEATPMSHFASTTKTNWQIDISSTRALATRLLDRCLEAFEKSSDLKTLDSQQSSLLIKNSICELPLHKCLIVLGAIEAAIAPPPQKHLLKLALARVAVHTASNLRFGPEVSIRRKKTIDADVFQAWFDWVQQM
ncbi:MAG: DNA methyltransferase, partial [Cyanobacteria bacterium J06642_11]